MIAIKTATLCTIASELDEAIDKLDPNNPAFAAVMNARALYRHHLMGKLTEHVYLDDTPMGYEAGYSVGPSGTFEG